MSLVPATIRIEGVSLEDDVSDPMYSLIMEVNPLSTKGEVTYV